jgi:hypothetical protein
MGVSNATSEFAASALLAAICFVPMRASASPAYACSVAEIFECTAVAGFQRVSAAQANLPPFVTLNVKEKKLFSGPGRGYSNPRSL